MSHNYLVQIAYNGDAFLGFQKCQEGPSIEGSLIQALSKIINHPVEIQATSRTDKGVHAEDQYFNFYSDLQLESKKFCNEMNSSLPGSIHVKSIQKRPLEFHPTLDCIKKRYRYQFSYKDHPYHTMIPHTINLESMQQASSALVGTHSFFAFCCRRSKYINFTRTITFASTTKIGSAIFFHIEGDQFMNKMVRMLASAIALVGTQAISLEELKELLNSQKTNRYIQPLAANALFLEKIFY